MSKLLVNIRGCNGAGKSTVPLQMLATDPDWHVLGTYPHYTQPGAKTLLSVFPKYGWVALGTYLNKTGGMDTLPNNETIKAALDVACDLDYDVLCEGVIASTIKSTYANWFNEYPDRKVIVLSLVPPVETCLARIQLRNGGKPINEKLVRDKWNIVDRNVEYFRDQGFTSVRIDNSRTPKDRMLEKFLKYIQKYKED